MAVDHNPPFAPCGLVQFLHQLGRILARASHPANPDTKGTRGGKDLLVSILVLHLEELRSEPNGLRGELFEKADLLGSHVIVSSARWTAWLNQLESPYRTARSLARAQCKRLAPFF